MYLQPCQIKVWLFFLMAGVLVPSIALANDGMPASIHQIIQDGQDVEITLQMADSGEPGISSAFKVARVGEDAEEVVFEDKVFEPGEAVYESEPGCRWWEPLSIVCDDYEDTCEDCDGDGDEECLGTCVENSSGQMECVEDVCGALGCDEDCNGDGTDDCWGWCETVYHFTMTDACVPAGDYEYHLYDKDPQSGEWHQMGWETTEFQVTESGQECTVSTTEDSDGVNCSVATVGTAHHGVIGFLIGFW